MLRGLFSGDCELVFISKLLLLPLFVLCLPKRTLEVEPTTREFDYMFSVRLLRPFLARDSGPCCFYPPE